MSTPRRDPPNKKLPDVHPDLEGFDVELNRFGEVDMTISIDVVNNFLDKEVDDPKLKQWGFGDDSEEDSSNEDTATNTPE